MDESLTFKELQQKVFQLLGPHLRGRRILVAVSGGLDSIVLLEVLKSLLQRLNFQIVVAHVFHGAKESRDFRVRAFNFVKECSEFTFVANVKDPQLDLETDDLGHSFPGSDEQSLREFRQKVLKDLARITESDWIAIGHHRDDLLETRLIRLIRGTGREGLKSMSVRGRKVIRPLLPFWRESLRQVAMTEKITFVNDPSNVDPKYLRNWIREQWLPPLEHYRPGAKQSLARSLDQLVRQSRQDLARLESLLTNDGVDRSALLILSHVEQRQVLATYLKRHNVKNYSASHVDEVLKRLKSNKKSFDFRVAGRVWQIGPSRVCIQD